MENFKNSTDQNTAKSKKRHIEPIYEEEIITFSPLLTTHKRVKASKPSVTDLIEESKEESEDEDDERMSPRLLIAMMAETTPRPSES